MQDSETLSPSLCLYIKQYMEHYDNTSIIKSIIRFWIPYYPENYPTLNTREQIIAASLVCQGQGFWKAVMGSAISKFLLGTAQLIPVLKVDYATTSFFIEKLFGIVLSPKVFHSNSKLLVESNFFEYSSNKNFYTPSVEFDSFEHTSTKVLFIPSIDLISYLEQLYISDGYVPKSFSSK